MCMYNEETETRLSAAAKILHRLILRSQLRLESYNVVPYGDFYAALFRDKVVTSIFAAFANSDDEPKIHQVIALATQELITKDKIAIAGDWIVLL